jgi:hypothetical protein
VETKVPVGEAHLHTAPFHLDRGSWDSLDAGVSRRERAEEEIRRVGLGWANLETTFRCRDEKGLPVVAIEVLTYSNARSYARKARS